MLYRIKRIINNETVSGWFALMSVLTIVISIPGALVLMGLAVFHWWNPDRKNKISWVE